MQNLQLLLNGNKNKFYNFLSLPTAVLLRRLICREEMRGLLWIVNCALLCSL